MTVNISSHEPKNSMVSYFHDSPTHDRHCFTQVAEKTDGIKRKRMPDPIAFLFLAGYLETLTKCYTGICQNCRLYSSPFILYGHKVISSAFAIVFHFYF